MTHVRKLQVFQQDPENSLLLIISALGDYNDFGLHCQKRPQMINFS